MALRNGLSSGDRGNVAPLLQAVKPTFSLLGKEWVVMCDITVQTFFPADFMYSICARE